MELLASRDGRLEDAQPGHCGVQIQLIPRRFEFETSVDISLQIRGKAPAQW